MGRTVGIVDYGMGNLLSVFHALEMVGAEAVICSEPEELRSTERIVLPGVGAFGHCMRNLKRTGFAQALLEAKSADGKPILGICLGMQVMAATGLEGAKHDGLGWFDAEVRRLQPGDASLRVPHVGWSGITYPDGTSHFARLPPTPDVYFVHSYFMDCRDSADVNATCAYGAEVVTAAVQKGTVFATQFHPEKSQDHGLQILRNFMAWAP